ncbi:antitoxin [Variovorax saccharolyticus]|uniref:antitoxin n=1 Tax=Variovorax saccharolyticus TaxID=3053516 RepID=UPI0025758608|nr:AbrB/MazE/SpoVT family DNA-binding domain-containing protein [Variovorax sp. J31P216]MDM0029099.1 AbrB/MazE/SpoVT family DNA-binding domain-containing protein [Variovorax sp. J31P216]
MNTDINKTARLFTTGGSQAVRLPAEFRFEGSTEVLIRRDASSGDVVLSPVKDTSWAAFAALREKLAEELATEGLGEYLRNRQQPSDGPRDPFADWSESRKTDEDSA